MATTRSGRSRSRAPVLTVTRYDLVSSFMMAVVVALIIAVVWLVILWLTNRISKPELNVGFEIIVGGGDPDGKPDDTLRVDSPEDVSDDPSLVDTPTDETEVTVDVENVIELADQSTEQVVEQMQNDSSESGKTGSADGTGGKPLGDGPGNAGGSNEQRWYVRFAEKRTLDEYARQLQYFGIELGVLQREGKLIYMSDLTSKTPKTRTTTTGENQKRLYMTWQGGGRRKADIQLFQRAGITVAGGQILHFYPQETQALMQKLELEYRNRAFKDIRKTYYVVRRSGDGYQFVVTRQRYYR